MNKETLLSECDLSIRLKNLLKLNDIITIGDLLKLNTTDLIKYRNFGNLSFNELDLFLETIKNHKS